MSRLLKKMFTVLLVVGFLALPVDAVLWIFHIDGGHAVQIIAAAGIVIFASFCGYSIADFNQKQESSNAGNADNAR